MWKATVCALDNPLTHLGRGCNCYLIPVELCSGVLVQCAPHKLRPLIIIIVSSTETAASRDFSCVCGFLLCWCWRFFIILRQNIFVWQGFLRGKPLATSQAYIFFLCKKAHQTKSFSLGWWKIISISTKASHIHRKNLRMLQLLKKMQLQIEYTPVELRPSMYVTEEPAEFYA